MKKNQSHADAEGRLTPPTDVPWPEIFPYETAGLVAKPVAPLTLPEPPRHGEVAAECSCSTGVPEHALWVGERWYLTPVPDTGIPGVFLNPIAHGDLEDLDDAMAAELGVLTVRIARALQALDGVGRVHVYRWGDGGAHLHIWFFARPAGFLQARGSSLADWTELLPPASDEDNRDVWDAAVAAVSTAPSA